MTIQVTPRFKAPRNPNKPRPITARQKRDGMSVEYLAKIRKLPSCISWISPVEAHHLRIKAERGVGLRASDKWALPLTPEEHRSVHKVGSRREADWFRVRGIDCYHLAAALWSNRHDLQAMYRVLLVHYHAPRRP
jgi:hypothetical protein